MTERLERLPSSDPRLGRHVQHDERSKGFRVVAPRRVELRDVRHRRRGRRLNQGQLGACTFFSLCHALKCEPLWPVRNARVPLSAGFAVRGYSLATTLDEFAGTYPPEDTGSSGLGACKAGVSLGVLKRFDWAFGGSEGRIAVMEQPVMQGTWWTNDMFHPDKDGRVHPTGGDAGGHEYTWIGIDVERRRSWFWNTWGVWGLDGSGLFYLTWDDQDALLARQGDLVVPRVV